MAGFSFGGAAPAGGLGGAPAAALGGATPAGGFSLGGAPGATAPITPATGGFGFGGGGGAPVTAAATTAATPAVAGFGGAAPAATTALATAAATTTTTDPPPTLEIPSYETLFPGRRIATQLRTALAAARAPPRLVSSSSLASYEQQTHSTTTNHNIHHHHHNSDDDAVRWAAQQVHHLVTTVHRTSLLHAPQNDTARSKPALAPDTALRQRLVQHPVVTLSVVHRDDNDSSAADNNNHGIDVGVPTTAVLTPAMLQDVFGLADDLRLSEADAICLYHAAATASSSLVEDHISQSPLVQQSRHRKKTTDDNNNNNTSSSSLSVADRARELYVADRPLLLDSCLQLLQQYGWHAANDTHDNDPGRFVRQATDELLQAQWMANLMAVVRDSTARIQTLLAHDAVSRAAAASTTTAMILGTTNHNSNNSSNDTSTDDRHWWRHTMALALDVQDRQTAVEAMLFAAYSIQLHVSEVAALVDLIRDTLSRDCVVLNPYQNVTDPFVHGSSTTTTAATTSSTPWYAASTLYESSSSSHPLHTATKSALAWDAQLVHSAWKSGQPPLLQCLATAVTAVLAALHHKAVLYDRTTHRPNVFGVGNALLPPGSTSLDGLSDLHGRFHNDAIPQWSRPDVLGLLMASYALLVRTLPSALSSPRAERSDVRKTWRYCMEAPARLQSFSMARLSLVPALQHNHTRQQRPHSSRSHSHNACDVSEFALSILADFGATYVSTLSQSGDRPISREKWAQDADEDLRLRRSHREQQQTFRGQFGTNVSTTVNDVVVPDAVNLMDRPDCMDDVLAFCTCLCGLGPAYASKFWATDDASGDLVPSPTMRDVRQQQEEDESLRPSYLSFLAALALAENHPPCAPKEHDKTTAHKKNGAAVIHDMYTTTTAMGNKEDAAESTSDWASVIEILRWYVRELDPQDLDRSGTGGTASSLSAAAAGGGSSTAYYYFDQGTVGDPISSNDRTSADGTASSRSNNKPRELGDENQFILLSHLALISNVAWHSPEARAAIVSTNVPIRSTDGTETIGQDSTLMILFTLGVMPLSPHVRGAVFETIARLLSTHGSTEAQISDSRKLARKSWELLEACQFVPIHKLEQYQSANDPNAHMAFPPSSTSMAVGQTQHRDWVPVDPGYAIVYEMVHIESTLGVYRSTEGFLQLLTSLFALGGCPADLGQNWRARSGAAPYMEYVLDFVLPRATGQAMNGEPLKFRSTDDKNRLCVRALQVVETALARYVVPTAPFSIDGTDDAVMTKLVSATRAAAVQTLGHSDLVQKTAILPNGEDVKALVDDFRPSGGRKTVAPTDGALSHSATSLEQQRNPATDMLPRLKAPGFSILAEMLCPVECNLFHAISSILVMNQSYSPSTISTSARDMTYALYISTPPTLSSAIEGATRSVPATKQQTLLKPLSPADVSNVSGTASDNNASWETQAVLGALRILCATLAREQLFRESVTALPGKAALVPALRFDRQTHLPSVINLNLERLSQMLIATNPNLGLVASIVDLIGVVSSNETSDGEVASAATAIVVSMERSLVSQKATQILSRGRNSGPDIARSIRSRLLAAASRSLELADIDLLRLIFDRILEDLRQGSSSVFVTAIFSLDERNSRLDGPRDALAALAKLLSDMDFVFGTQTADLASSGYEILYRLTEIERGDHALLVGARLREINFWSTHLISTCSVVSQPYVSLANSMYAYHAIAWLIKGAANEIHLLAGFARGEIRPDRAIEGLVAPRPVLYQNLCRVLFSEEGAIVRVLYVLPIEKPSLDHSYTGPIDEKAISGAKVALRGAPEVVQRYTTIDGSKLVKILNLKCSGAETDAFHSWADQWNHFVASDCASAHLSDAIYIATGALSSNLDVISPRFDDTVIGSRLLFSIVERMTVPTGSVQSSEQPETSFFTTASRNLALAARMIASYSSRQVDGAVNPIDRANVCNLLIQAIALSGSVVGQTGLDADRLLERISSLASATVLVLRDLPDSSLGDGDQSYSTEAAGVLLRLVGMMPSSKIPSVSPCLSLLLGMLDEAAIRVVLTDSISPRHPISTLHAIINLIPSFDAAIVNVLLDFTTHHSVSDLLLKSGILKQLQSAADKYSEEERQFREGRSTDFSYRETRIATPQYLIGHFQLMGALVVTSGSDQKADNIVIQVISIIRSYAHILERAMDDFPRDGNVLLAMLECMATVNTVLLSTGQGGKNSLPIGQQESLGDILSETKVFKKIVMLSMHLAENPLPKAMSVKLPSRFFAHAHNTTMSNVLVTVSPDACSWWDSLVDQSTQLNHDVVRLGVHGCDLLRYCLLTLRGSTYLSNLDEHMLARAICRITNAVVHINHALRSARQMYSSNKLDIETEQLAVHGSKLSDVLIEVVSITTARVREMNVDRMSATATSFCGTISFALDHCRIESLFLEYVPTNENRSPIELCKSLRNELKQK